ncbi:MAG: hypothetical protein AB2A00_07350 [Myxococcota bacterium]
MNRIAGARVAGCLVVAILTTTPLHAEEATPPAPVESAPPASTESRTSPTPPAEPNLPPPVVTATPRVTLRATDTRPPASSSARQLAVSSGIGVAVGAAAAAAFATLSAALIGVVVAPIGVAWATGDNQGFQVGMFLQMAPALFGILFIPFIPVVMIMGAVADAFGFAAAMHYLRQDGLAALLAAGIMLIPTAALLTVGLGAQLLLLGLLSTAGASSMGRRLPGDPNGLVYLALVGGTVVALGLGTATYLFSLLVARPALHRTLSESLPQRRE